MAQRKDYQIDAADWCFWSSRNEFYRDSTSRRRSWSLSFLPLDSHFQIYSESDFVYHLRKGMDWQLFRFRLRCQKVAMKDHFIISDQFGARLQLALAQVTGSATVESTGSLVTIMPTS